MSDTIITVKHDLVTVLYLNRPQTLNCFNNELLETLASTLQKLDADPSVRCVVITGSGRGFCAGGDLGGLSWTATPRRKATRICGWPTRRWRRCSA